MAEDLNSLRIEKSLKSNPADSPKSGWIKWIIGAVVVVAGIFWWYRAPTAIDVEMLSITASSQHSASFDEEIVLNATGYIVSAHRIALAPKIVGRVAATRVDMGDKVKKGDVLVRLEDDEYRARVAQQQGQLDSAKARLAELEAGSRPQEIAQAQAGLDQALADLQFAKLNVERNRNLTGTNVVSQQAIDDAEARFGLAKGKTDAARAALELAKIGPRTEQIAAQRALVEEAQGMLDLVKLDLANTIIVAPIDGTILDRNVEVGEYVTTGFVGDRGAKGYVVSIADLTDLRVELDISQSDFPKIASGQHCTVTTDAYPDRKYAGVVHQISPEANRQKATVLVKVKITQPDELLRPDMNAGVSFHPTVATTQPAGSPAGFVIPPSALVGKMVFIEEYGKTAERMVEVGPTLTSGVRITHGLNEGDHLIVNPPADLKVGQPVQAKPRSGGTHP